MSTHPLYKPYYLGNVRLRNRLVMAPMGTRLAAPGGLVTRELVDYYVTRAQGGVGTIITEHSCIDGGASRANPTQLGVYDDSLVPGLNWLAEALAACGSTVIAQLNHAGRQTSSASIGTQPVSASSVMCPNGEMARELTKDEIIQLIENFTKAAERSIRAGFAGVEIHCTHGYLLNQFLSPHINKREDEYGRDRALLVVQIAQGIREKIGDKPIVGVRLASCDYRPGGIEIEYACEVAQRLESETKLNYIHVSAGNAESVDRSVQPTYHPHGTLLPNVEKIRQACKLPIMAVGSITTMELAQETIDKGTADLITLGRALLADADFPKKTVKGIQPRPCIRCNEGCIGRAPLSLPMRCAVDWKTGREAQWNPKRISKERSVVVIGGGPAGMQAALIAKERGFKVHLYEAKKELGGQLIAASIPIFKEDLRRYRDYLVEELLNSKCNITLNTDLTMEHITALQPNNIIAATGSQAIVPSVLQSNKIPSYTATDALINIPKADNLVIVGGGTVGCETAMHLAQEGKHVTLIEMTSQIAYDSPFMNRMAIEYYLNKLGVSLQLETKAVRLLENRLMLDCANGPKTLEVEALIVAVGSIPKTIDNLLQETEIPVEFVGDCQKPGSVFNAISSAAWTAARI